MLLPVGVGVVSINFLRSLVVAGNWGGRAASRWLLVTPLLLLPLLLPHSPHAVPSHGQWGWPTAPLTPHFSLTHMHWQAFHLLIVTTGAGLITEHHPPDWLGGQWISTGAHALTGGRCGFPSATPLPAFPSAAAPSRRQWLGLERNYQFNLETKNQRADRCIVNEVDFFVILKIVSKLIKKFFRHLIWSTNESSPS